MCLSALAFLLFPESFARVYTRDGVVIALAAALIPIAGVFQVFDGVQAVCAGVLRGAGDTRVPMLANLLGFWALGLPVGAAFAFRLGLGPAGLWWGLVVGLAAVAVILLWRVRVKLATHVERVDVEGRLVAAD